MGLRILAAAVVGLAISIFLVAKFMGTGSAAVAINPNKVLEPRIDPIPIKKTGPQPKIQLSEYEYRFRRMEVGETQSHDFVVFNNGEGPLVVKMGKLTCQCTYATLKEGEEITIQPGKSDVIKLTWKPEHPADDFSKGADIITNDPDPSNQKIFLRVTGHVGEAVTIFPPGQWNCPDLLDDKPAICTGTVSSGVLDIFQITSIESRGVPIEYKLVQLEGEMLEKAHRASFGFQVNLKVTPDRPMGVFAFPVTIKTDVPEKGENVEPGKMTQFEVLVSGVRRGPLRFTGSNWLEEQMAVVMGSFANAAGKQVVVPMFIHNPPAEGLQFTKPPETVPPDLKLELLREEKSEGKSARYNLKVSYPPKAPRVEHRSQNPGRIRLWTNHPNAPEMELLVYMKSE
jgi:hypothetical protein